MRVMVTGSNRGIGLEYVRQLLARGDRVFAMCRKPDDASELQVLKGTYGDQLSIFPLDVADENSIASAYEAVSAETDALDVLINNAAINPGDESFGDLKKENFMKTFEVNVVGVMLVTQYFADLLKQGDRPRLINLSSGVASLAEGAPAGLYSYNVSKTALNMLNRTMTHELKPMGIISIVIDPGWVITDMGGPGAQLQPEESVRNQLAVIDGLTMDDCGSYKHYSGREIAW